MLFQADAFEGAGSRARSWAGVATIAKPSQERLEESRMADIIDRLAKAK
jgi:hypothetical protein